MPELAIDLGASQNDSIWAQSLDSFSGNVTLTLSGANTASTAILSSTLGSGAISYTFSGSPLSLAANVAAYGGVTLTVGSSVPSGDYEFIVTGTSGFLTHEAPIVVQVPTPSFTITALPSPVIAPDGSNPTTTVTVTSVNGFAGTVDLTPYPFGPETLSPTSVTVSAGG